MHKPVTTHYLEMLDIGQLMARPCPDPDMVILECQVKQGSYNRFLYQWIGGPWSWVDKLSWTDDQWRSYAEAECLRTWVAYVRGCPAGYFELLRHDNGDVQIAYFGLAGPFIGQGLGGYLLTCAIREAWAWDAKRIWTHTCTLDHPNALTNYQGRGMRIYRSQQSDSTPGDRAS